MWLESETGFTFGPGQAELLQLTRELGSLRKAATHMGMSYRRAWGRIKKLEETIGHPLLYKAGGNKAGFELTPDAQDLIAKYNAWQTAVTRFAQAKALECLPRELQPQDAAHLGGKADNHG